MKFKRTSLFLCITLVILAAVFPTLRPTAAQSPQQNNDMPYLMAFSNSPAPHFVIERADGSDSRDFATDLMPPNTNVVNGAGWSPAGDWFAWTAETIGGGGAYSGARPFILSADGQTRLTALDDMNLVEMAWSPNRDVLAVAGLVNPPEVSFDPQGEPAEVIVTHRIGLFDPATNAFVASQEFELPFDFQNRIWLNYRVEWSADGAFFVAFRDRDTDEGDGPENVDFYVLGPDIPFSETTLPANTLLHDLNPYGYEPDFRNLVVSPAAEIVQLDANQQAALLNLATHTSTPLSVPDGEVITRMQWSADGTQALVETLKECTEVGCPHNTSYRYADGTLTEILPARLSPAHLYPAPDFSGALLVELIDGTGWAASYLNLADLSLTPLDIYVDMRPITFLQWTGDHRVIIATEHGSDQVDFFTAFDFADGPVTIGQFNLTIYNYGDSMPAVAPNSPVAYLPNAMLYRADLSSGEITTLPPDPRRFFTSNRGSVEWHPTQDYAILFEDALAAGGGAPMYTGIASADGSVHRPVGYCFTVTPRCIEWLPAQVDLTTLDPGHNNTPPAPFITIPMGRWTDELIWSPAVHQIAAGYEMRWYGDAGPFDVWDVTTGELVTTLPDVTYDQTLTWPEMQPVVVSREVAAPDTYPRILAAMPDGALTVQLAASADGYFADKVEVVDATGQAIFIIDDPYIDWHASASIDPFGTLLAISSASTPLRLYDVATGEMIYEMPLVYSNAVAFSPDGHYLAIAYGTEIRIYIIGDLLAAGMD